MTIYHLTVDNDTATRTVPSVIMIKSFATGSTVSHFTDSSSVCVVCQSSGDTSLSSNMAANGIPFKAGSDKFNRSRVVFAIPDTDTNTSDFINTTISNNQWKRLLHTSSAYSSTVGNQMF